ncbi:hypothetical protein ACE1ET_02445 [Saccharicrinis sp. FJH62]|uniref:hypothetical protein n=1 Tax=Saccharicrinis sp. FJH62 TaxID=3344657 RepID=UPI0035D43D1F
MSDLNEEIIKVLNEYSDLDNLILRMELYTIDRLGRDPKQYEGLEPIDFVFVVFEKAIQSIRNWDKSIYSFEQFAFGVLKSEISDFREKRKRRYKELNDTEGSTNAVFLELQDYYDEMISEDPSFKNLEFNEQKDKFISLLKEEGCTVLEQLIFDCWCEGMYKPSEISNFLEVEIDEIYNAIKRLKSRKVKAIKRYE